MLTGVGKVGGQRRTMVVRGAAPASHAASARGDSGVGSRTGMFVHGSLPLFFFSPSPPSPQRPEGRLGAAASPPRSRLWSSVATLTLGSEARKRTCPGSVVSPGLPCSRMGPGVLPRTHWAWGVAGVSRVVASCVPLPALPQGRCCSGHPVQPAPTRRDLPQRFAQQHHHTPRRLFFHSSSAAGFMNDR